MSKISLYAVVFTIALSTFFSTHAACHANYQTMFETFQNGSPNQTIRDSEKLPMASIISTPNVQYMKDDSGLYFYAYFNGFHTETCLEGDFYGFQIFCDDAGEVFAASCDYCFEELDDEEMMMELSTQARPFKSFNLTKSFDISCLYRQRLISIFMLI